MPWILKTGAHHTAAEKSPNWWSAFTPNTYIRETPRLIREASWKGIRNSWEHGDVSTLPCAECGGDGPQKHHSRMELFPAGKTGI